MDAAGAYTLSVDDVGFVPKVGEVCQAGCSDCEGRGTSEVRQGLPGCACECMDLAEDNPAQWGSYASPDHTTAVNTTMTSDLSTSRVGASSIHAVTDASLDWAVVYPEGLSVIWDLSQTAFISFWTRGENANVPDWQGAFPEVVVRDDFGAAATYTPSQNLLQDAWTHHLVPLAGGDGWSKSGAVTLSNIRSIEFHADTWENAFEFWIDGLAFRQANATCLSTCLSACPTGTCQDLNGMPTCY